ncbi:HAD-IIIC family phosphatase [Kutzneria sp. CA-103260]|uniref:HAD-IIIC family phosphatase n=1 Tax=Kutzneria sp. CA-103260 TaxID=2802641 RepID=UPI001BA47329|nr:HAD-IIIC family phosphatase [Kutzneria sp. CA-103260]QUQ68804.1 Thioesterase domain protein [Kutzneria sp. CA-103260]
MSRRVRVAATFPARPVIRPFRALAGRLGLDIGFEYVSDNSVHFRHHGDDEPVAWDILLVRVLDWAAGTGTEADERFEANLAELERSLAGAGARFTRGAVVCLCPSVGDTDVAAAYEAEVTARLRALPSVSVVASADVVQRYSVRDHYRTVQSDGLQLPTNDLLTACATATMRAVHERERVPVKAIAVDADYTLWEGACSEVPADELRLGNGRALFQRTLRDLGRRGVLLCLVSQNAPADIEAAFRRVPAFPLTLDDFVVVRAGWSPKPDLLASVADDLDLSVDSFVFLDDNPGECARMRESLPSVWTVRFPQHDGDVPGFVDRMWAFDVSRTTSADSGRLGNYRSAARRRRAMAEAPDKAEFVATLGLVVDVRPALPEDLPRVAQLSERTTQFTTSSRALDETVLAANLARTDRGLLVVDVADRFGDYGLTGAVSYAVEATALHVDAFALSCRVLHRDVEHRVLAKLAETAIANGLDRLRITTVSTSRNLPARTFLNRVGAAWRDEPDGTRTADLSVDSAVAPPAPAPADAPTRPSSPAPSAGHPASIFLADLAERLVDVDALRTALAEQPDESITTDPDEPTKPPSRQAQGLWLTRIRHIWEDLLGVRGIGLGDHVFQRWGATSVDALKMCAELRDTFGNSVSLAEMLALGTIREQADALCRSASTPVPTVTTVCRGSGTPIVFLPPAGGLAFAYLELIREIAPDHLVLVTQAPELTRRDDALLDLPELVRVYRSEITTRLRGTAPVLVGWSFGALLAYELAVTLNQRQPLLLFDPPRNAKHTAPTHPLDAFFDLLDPYHVTTESLAEIDRAVFPDSPAIRVDGSVADVWSVLLKRLLDTTNEQQRDRLLIPELGPMDVLRAARVWKKNQQLAARYSPSPGLVGTSYVFEVAGSVGEHMLHDALGDRAVSREYAVAPIAGLRAHSAMMERENMLLFKDDVRAALRTVGPGLS